MPTRSTARPSRINPNWYFWLENIPSGNPGKEYKQRKQTRSEKFCDLMAPAIFVRMKNVPKPGSISFEIFRQLSVKINQRIAI
jgi:hypothetical protein